MNIHLCQGDETLEQALAFINDNDSENRRFEMDPERDRCYVGDEAFASADAIINYKNTYYACHVTG